MELFTVTCHACGRKRSIPEKLFSSKISGHQVAIPCKGCGAEIHIDGSVPPAADGTLAPGPLSTRPPSDAQGGGVVIPRAGKLPDVHESASDTPAQSKAEETTGQTAPFAFPLLGSDDAQPDDPADDSAAPSGEPSKKSVPPPSPTPEEQPSVPPPPAGSPTGPDADDATSGATPAAADQQNTESIPAAQSHPADAEPVAPNGEQAAKQTDAKKKATASKPDGKTTGAKKTGAKKKATASKPDGKTTDAKKTGDHTKSRTKQPSAKKKKAGGAATTSADGTPTGKQAPRGQSDEPTQAVAARSTGEADDGPNYLWWAVGAAAVIGLLVGLKTCGDSPPPPSSPPKSGTTNTITPSNRVPTPASARAPEPETEPAPALSVSATPMPSVSSLAPSASSSSAAAPSTSSKVQQHPAAAAADFDAAAATSLVRSALGAATQCRGDFGPGNLPVAVTFAPTGSVTNASVTGPPFLGSPVASCTARILRRLRVKPFRGGARTVTATRYLR